MKKIKIAVTGGIGSGKSSLCKLLKELQFPVFSCDEIYRTLQTSEQYLASLENAFTGVVENGKLNREKLSSIVFSNPTALQKLNELSHPLIMERLHSEMDKSSSVVVFAEVPLLFEGNFQSQFDFVFVVLRNQDERIRSVSLRDGLNETQVLARIQNQFDYQSLKEEGNIFFLKNDETISTLKENVKTLLHKLGIAVS